MTLFLHLFEGNLEFDSLLRIWHRYLREKTCEKQQQKKDADYAGTTATTKA